MLKKILCLYAVVQLLTSCQVGRFIYYNFADITDHEIFPARELTGAATPFQFKKASVGNYPKSLNGEKLEDFLERTNTVAFLIIKNDTIQYENYFHGYQMSDPVASFSMAKSVTSILIGCAIEDGLIPSVEIPITDYLPELKANGFEKVKLKHVLQMTSGLNFNESYVNPFGHAASFYYGKNLRDQIARLELKREPGTQFEYVSGNTQLLGLILERALNGMTVTQYLQKKLWTPLSMEYDASWSLDQEKDGLEKTFCCLNARARDFAKIGRLYLNQGNWNGEQLVPASWVAESTKVDTTEGSVNYYQYQWWLPTPGQDFLARGILGQFIYVHPKENLIIVRLGKDKGGAEWPDIFTSLAREYAHKANN